ncbi:MAG: hypothetical protein Q8N36_05855 [bacterium]|nr:hypothetical protein [bacterium]
MSRKTLIIVNITIMAFILVSLISRWLGGKGSYTDGLIVLIGLIAIALGYFRIRYK